jgi:hypothetical protein
MDLFNLEPFMVFMKRKKMLKLIHTLLITLSLSMPVYAGEVGVPDDQYDTSGDGVIIDTVTGDRGPEGPQGPQGRDGERGPEGPAGPAGRDGGDRYIYVDSGECPGTYDGVSFCGDAHREHYNDCGHPGRGRDRDRDGRYRDRGGDDDWRDRRTNCESRYAACSEIACHSRYNEFRSCERYEEDYERDRGSRRGSRDGRDCISCNSSRSDSSYAENVSAWMNPLAYIATGLGSAYLGYRGQKAWANAYASGQQQCTSRFNSYLDYNITRGSNPILPEQADPLMQCNNSPMGGYAGMGGMSSNGYGGFGNPYASAGYSGGFLGGMAGPYGGMGNGMGMGMGAGAGFNISLGAGLQGGMGMGGMQGGGMFGGGGMYAGGAGMGSPGGFYMGGNGAMVPGGWNGAGNGSYWNNGGNWGGNQYWQGQQNQMMQQQQQWQSRSQFANQRNMGNYMTGQAAGNALAQNYNQAVTSYGLGMQNQGQSGYYGAAPYQMNNGLQGQFSYGVNYGFGR